MSMADVGKLRPRRDLTPEDLEKRKTTTEHISRQALAFGRARGAAAMRPNQSPKV